jgi:hypothetical protein
MGMAIHRAALCDGHSRSRLRREAEGQRPCSWPSRSWICCIGWTWPWRRRQRRCFGGRPLRRPVAGGPTKFWALRRRRWDGNRNFGRSVWPWGPVERGVRPRMVPVPIPPRPVLTRRRFPVAVVEVRGRPRPNQGIGRVAFAVVSSQRVMCRH